MEQLDYSHNEQRNEKKQIYRHSVHYHRTTKQTAKYCVSSQLQMRCTVQRQRNSIPVTDWQYEQQNN
jgi:hypothetical protein